ncbi:CPBP family intramembrane glutamic endopeptidase [Sphingobium ummariense]
MEQVEPPATAWLARHLPVASGVLKPGPRRPLRSVAWLVGLLVALVAILSLQSIVRSVAPNPTLLLGIAFLTVVLAYGAYAGLVRRFEHRLVEELAFTRLPAELVGGVLLGIALMSLIVGALWVFGAYDVTAGRWSDFPHDAREALGTGLLEELLARLVIFRMLACAIRVRPALVFSALLFGGAHLANPHASMVTAAAIAVEAGLMLAGFYLLTGRIWLSVGVHAGWNFAQGGIFGAPVSGMPSDGSLLVSLPRADFPTWVTGGAFGPEGSLVAVIIGAAAFCVTLVALRRETWTAPMVA